MRLRIFDLATKWFWFVAFYQPRSYGEPWLCVNVFKPAHGTWINVWQWEKIPDPGGGYARTETEPLEV